jgi:EmrB/QacA subfamily drug resistance transporter
VSSNPAGRTRYAAAPMASTREPSPGSSSAHSDKPDPLRNKSADSPDDPATLARTGFVRDPDAEARMSPWRRNLLATLEARGRYRSAVLITALAGMFATSFPITILAVSLAPIADEFGSPETTIAWVISAPMLLSAVTFPLLGKLGDLRGHRTIFLLGFGGATLVAALTALAWDANSLIGFRTLAAILGGATQPTAMALIFAAYPPEERVRAMGWWSMTTAAAPALGLAVGGPLVDVFGWRVVFLLQAGLSLVALAMAYLVLRETPSKRVRFDLAGSITLAVGIGGLMFALGSLRGTADSSSIVATSLVIGTLGLVSFVLIERRIDHPLLPLEFFRSRNFSATLVTNAFTSGGYMGAFIIAPLFLYHMGFSATVTSFIILMRTATLSLASPVGGRLGERMGERGAAVFGCLLLTVGLMFTAWGAYQDSLTLFVAGLIGQGAGHGLSQPSIAAAIARSVDESDLGIAAASNRLMGQGGAAFGITLLTLTYGGVDSSEAFGWAFVAGTFLSAISVVSALFMGTDRIIIHRSEEATD